MPLRRTAALQQAPEAEGDTPHSASITAHAESQQGLDFARSYKITNDTEYKSSGGVLEELVQFKKSIEDRRNKITKPQYQAWQEALALFRKPLMLLDESIACVRAEIGRYTLERNARDEQRLQVAAKAGDRQAIVRVAEEQVKPDGVSVKGSWTHEVLDPGAVPNEYCVITKTVNQRLIEIAIEQGVREIAGVRIYQRAEVRRTGRKKEDL